MQYPSLRPEVYEIVEKLVIQLNKGRNIQENQIQSLGDNLNIFWQKYQQRNRALERKNTEQ